MYDQLKYRHNVNGQTAKDNNKS